MLGKKLGKKALLPGAIAQSIPDIDFIAVLWNDTAGNLLAHRGFSHSILFDGLCVILLAIVAEYFYKSHRIGIKKWMLFLAVQISLHLFLDLFNNYGTGLLEPFSHRRFSFNAIFVADPLFSIWPLAAFIALVVLKKNSDKRKFWWKFGLSGAIIYLAVCSYNKILVEKQVKQSLAQQNISYQSFLTTPAPLNNLLWFVVVKSDSGFYTSYRSVLDDEPVLNFNYFPQNNYLLQSISNQEELQKLKRFSQDYYTIEKWNDTLVFNDLRFGQVIGWHDPEERFVFHYYLQHSDESNRLVVQRGRFAKWDRGAIRSLWNRMKGK